MSASIFDNRHTHLHKNIYQSLKGQIRLAILKRDLLLQLTQQSQQSRQALDIGCGSGIMSRWLSKKGYQVVAIDNAKAMIEKAIQETADDKMIQYIHANYLDDSLKLSINSAQLILCHAVLEWLNNPWQFIEKMWEDLTPNGYLSLMFYNAWAREFAQLSYGNFDYIESDYRVKNTVKLNPANPLNPQQVIDFITQLGGKVIDKSGVRVFYDVMKTQQSSHFSDAKIIEHELRMSKKFPFWQMARYIHLVVKK